LGHVLQRDLISQVHHVPLAGSDDLHLLRAHVVQSLSQLKRGRYREGRYIQMEV
jgi:hypothetical protein